MEGVEGFDIVGDVRVEFGVGEMVWLRIFVVEMLDNRRIEVVGWWRVRSMDWGEESLIECVERRVFVGGKDVEMINDMDVVEDGDLVRGRRLRWVIVMKEVMGEREGVVLIEGEIRSMWDGVGMDRVVVNEEGEGVVVMRVVLDGVDGMMGNDVGYVRVVVNGMIVLGNEVGIIVMGVWGENLGVMKW